MILDAGFLISVDRGEQAAHAFLTAASRSEQTLRTTQPVVAQVWRSGARQARLAALLNTIDPAWGEVTPADNRAVRLRTR